MRFDRKGLNQVPQAVDVGQIDAVIVKDLSRLGRNQMQTALFIDYLRQCGVAVISVTEGLNTMDDGHDLIIGVRQIMNDYYAKDIGNKIRHGYRQKQKEGLVIAPPFGYWKDRIPPLCRTTNLRRLRRLWEMKRPAINTHIADLYNEIRRLEQEIDDLLLEKIQSGG
jgi:DNA invertase Pin-like site-specific DNA recombinase